MEGLAVPQPALCNCSVHEDAGCAWSSWLLSQCGPLWENSPVEGFILQRAESSPRPTVCMCVAARVINIFFLLELHGHTVKSDG